MTKNKDSISDLRKYMFTATDSDIKGYNGDAGVIGVAKKYLLEAEKKK